MRKPIDDTFEKAWRDMQMMKRYRDQFDPMPSFKPRPMVRWHMGPGAITFWIMYCGIVVGGLCWAILR